MVNLFGLFGARRSAGCAKSGKDLRNPFRFRPMVESLEGRVVPSATMMAPAAPLISTVAPITQPATSLLPINISGISVVNTNGTPSLVANGTLGGQNIQIPLSLSAQPSSGSTSILSLHLAPIKLNLLGLTVKTSEICLNITAQPGHGNLLGNLLSRVAHLLDNGLSLNQVLGTLNSATQMNTLTSGLTSMLNGALGQLLSATSVLSGSPTVTSTTSSSGTTTNILHLSLGPVNLNLLGLKVNLDNCAGGPVTVDIGAKAGPGMLLGNLLTDLAGLLNNPATTSSQLLGEINQIAGAITSILTPLI